MKNNDYYFSHDWLAHEDPKILELKMNYWLEWYWLYREIIERLFNAWWKLLLKQKKAIAYQLHIDSEKFDNIFSLMIEVWLLKNDDDFFWSDSLLIRQEKLQEIREKRAKAWRLWWLAKWRNSNSEEQSEKEDKQMLSKWEANAKQKIANKTKQNKIKQNKTKEKNYKYLGYLEAKKIQITEEEHSRLIEDFWHTIVKEYLLRLDFYIGSKGQDPYKDHNLAVRQRMNKDWVKKKAKQTEEKKVEKQESPEERKAAIEKFKNLKSWFTQKSTELWK